MFTYTPGRSSRLGFRGGNFVLMHASAVHALCTPSRFWSGLWVFYIELLSKPRWGGWLLVVRLCDGSCGSRWLAVHEQPAPPQVSQQKVSNKKKKKKQPRRENHQKVICFIRKTTFKKVGIDLILN